PAKIGRSQRSVKVGFDTLSWVSHPSESGNSPLKSGLSLHLLAGHHEIIGLAHRRSIPRLPFGLACRSFAPCATPCGEPAPPLGDFCAPHTAAGRRSFAGKQTVRPILPSWPSARTRKRGSRSTGRLCRSSKGNVPGFQRTTTCAPASNTCATSGRWL